METEASIAFGKFAATLQAAGLRQGLAGILARTDYRFIGIWRFEGGKAKAAVHYDRENPDRLLADEVADDATYCCYVRESRRSFETPDSMIDPRLLLHPARTLVRTYCGVPVMDSMGTVLGTLCHYDVVPRDPSQVDLELMVNVAGFLAQGGHVPPYPAARH